MCFNETAGYFRHTKPSIGQKQETQASSLLGSRNFRVFIAVIVDIIALGLSLVIITGGTAFAPADGDVADGLAAGLLQAMVSAAKADGLVTKTARANIDAQLGALGLGEAATATIKDELDAPLDVGRIAALAEQPEDAVQLYAASLLVVDPNGPAEAAYLASLADTLGLAADLVAHLHAKAATLQAA